MQMIETKTKPTHNDQDINQDQTLAKKIVCPHCGNLQHEPDGYNYLICDKCERYIYDYRNMF